MATQVSAFLIIALFTIGCIAMAVTVIVAIRRDITDVTIPDCIND